MYVKLFSKILDSSIADNRPLRHFFTDLLLCADGKGYVVMTEGALARRIGATLDEVRWGLAELQKPDAESHSPGSEGRRIERLEGVGYGWRIINYEHYRAMKDADQLREATKERVRRHREKKAGNVSVTSGNASNGIAEVDADEEAKAEALPASDKPKTGRAKVVLTDDAFLESLKADPTYLGINVDLEAGKSRRWCEANNRQPTRKFFVNWLNKAITDRPMQGAKNGNDRPSFIP